MNTTCAAPKLDEASSSEPGQRLPSQCQVICVCGGLGFPLTAGASRIVNIGKALRAGGIGLRVLHCGPSPVPRNTERAGVYEGIPFQYTACVKKPKSAPARFLVYIWALAGLTARLVRLWPERRRTVVYMYIMHGPLLLYVGWLCRLLGFPLVQEMCEWFPQEDCYSGLTKWIYRKAIFRQATGFLVISKMIERHVRERSAAANPSLLIHRLPCIVDSGRFLAAPPRDRNGDVPHFVWCGVGWRDDALFLVRALRRVELAGYRAKLRMMGAFTDYEPDLIPNYAREQGLSPDALVLMGCVDDRTLVESYNSSTALLLPLWDDKRSRTRLPNKLGEYLASGRPVITGKMGDLLDFLEDGVSAYIGEPGDERQFAENMIAVLRDPARAAEIGAAGQRACLKTLDYRAHTDSLAKFFTACVERRAGA
jgi:glycosyltransferase involved in cell wall biosynthesis